MADIEKVIKGLECCVAKGNLLNCKECPYYGKSCTDKIHLDALELLKEQQQMYYTLEHDWRMLREQLKLDCN